MGLVEQLRLHPFVRLLIPLVIGVLLQLNGLLPVSPEILFFAFTGLLVILVFLHLLIKNSRRFIIIGVGINLFLVLAGVLVTQLKDEKRLISDNHQQGMMVGTIVKQPKAGDKTIKTVLEIEAINKTGKWTAANGNIVLYFRKDSVNPPQLALGDRIVFDVAVQTPLAAKNPNEFDYKNYLAYHLITKQAFLKAGQWQKIGNNIPTDNISLWAAEIQQKVVGIFRCAHLQPDNFSIISALTVGYKDLLSAETRQSFSQTGAMHVLAVSGLHVGIIYLVLNYLLSFFFKKKRLWIKTILMLLVLWSYALITGFSPSVLRASVMFSFIVVGENLKRPKNIYNTIAASAFLLLLFNPYNLVEIGFWLSYLAVLGIIFLHPKIYGLLYFGKSFFGKAADKVWSLIAVSIAAQIATFPIGLFFFHQFPNYFILTNLFVIPLVSVIVYVAMLLLVVSPLPVVFSFVAGILDHILSFMLGGIRWIQSLPFAFDQDIAITKHQMVLLYLIILSFVLILLWRKSVPVFAFFGFVLIFLSTTIYNEFVVTRQREFIVYAINRETAYNFVDGQDNIFFSSLAGKDKKLNYHVKSNWLALGVKNEKLLDIKQMDDNHFFRNFLVIQNPHFFLKRNYIGFYDKKMVVFNRDYSISPRTITGEKLKVNYILLSENTAVSIQTLLRLFDFKTIIMDASNSRYKISEWKDDCRSAGVNCYIVPEQGAFVEKFSDSALL
ncbi:MAG: ComEC/Rec2 family competence protein [Bacteroidales bacterium]|nr:ComEC/Rec2 family competence protein [Bacteroidales bacterium]